MADPLPVHGRTLPVDRWPWLYGGSSGRPPVHSSADVLGLKPGT